MGTVFAYNLRSYKRWRQSYGRERSGRASAMLTGNALEAAVAGIATLFPDNVVRVSA